MEKKLNVRKNKNEYGDIVYEEFIKCHKLWGYGVSRKWSHFQLTLYTQPELGENIVEVRDMNTCECHYVRWDLLGHGGAGAPVFSKDFQESRFAQEINISTNVYRGFCDAIRSLF